MIFDNPNHAPVALDYFQVVSVSSSTSMQGGFRGLYVGASTSITMTSRTGNEVFFNNIKPGVILWISGAFVNQIHTNVSVAGLH